VNIDDVVNTLESDFQKILTDKILLSLAGFAPAFFASPFGGAIIFLLRPLVQYGVNKIIKFLDLKAYYIYKAQTNIVDAVTYQDRIRDTNKAVESGDKDAIKLAEAAQKAAFSKLIDLAK
jgi:hypothetical protein